MGDQFGMEEDTETMTRRRGGTREVEEYDASSAGPKSEKKTHFESHALRFHPLSFSGLFSNSMMICMIVFTLGTAAAGISRMPDGAIFNHLPLPVGVFAYAFVLLFAGVSLLGIFRAFGAGNFHILMDLHCLFEMESQERHWNHWLIALANPFTMFIGSFLGSLLSLCVVGSRHLGYPAGIGLGAVAIAHTSSSIWAWFRVCLTQLAASLFTTFSAMLVFKVGTRREAPGREASEKAHKSFQRSRFSVVPVFLFGASLACIYIGASFVFEPVLFPVFATGPGAVHAISAIYADAPHATNFYSTTYKLENCDFNATLAELGTWQRALQPYTDNPTLYAVPWDYCLNAVAAAAAERSFTTWLGMYPLYRVHVAAHNTTHALFEYAYVQGGIWAIITGCVAGIIVGMAFFMCIWLGWGKTRKLGELWPLEKGRSLFEEGRAIALMRRGIPRRLRSYTRFKE